MIEALNRFFERVGLWSYDHRWIVLAISLALLGTSLHFAAGVRFDNSFEAYFDRGDPVYERYLKYREDFGSDELAYIVYEAPDVAHGPWNLEIMHKIKALTAELENGVPFIKEVTSLTNVEFMEGVPDGLEIYELLDDFPERQEQLLEVREKVLAKPFYVGGLVSEDGQYAAIMLEAEKSSIDPLDEIRLDPEGGDALENLYPQASSNAIDAILAKPEYAGIRFHHTGDVPLNSAYNYLFQSESAKLLTIALIVVAALLTLFFRASIGVIGPLAIVLLSIFAAVGFIGIAGWNMDLMFTMVPVLLIAVGIADAVHIISEFRANHARYGDRREAARRTLALVGTPCLLTSLTTAMGFGAMAISPIKTIQHFALYSAFGVLAAFILSTTLLMFFLGIGPRHLSDQRKEKELRHAKGGARIDRFLQRIVEWNIRYRRHILATAAVVFAASIAGLAQLKVDSNFLSEFSDRLPIKQSTLFADNTIGGSGSLTYIFDSGTPDGIKDPAVLREIERIDAQARTHDHVVTKTYSIVDIIKDINQSFHGGDPGFHIIPDDRNTVAQYLLVYEMSGGEEVEEYVSSDYARANLELRAKMVESSLYEGLVDSIDAYLVDEPLETTSAEVTGMGSLWITLMDYIVQSQIRGFLLAFVVIAFLMCIIFRSVPVGMLSMIPNLSPVLLTLGMMGWLDIPLDYVRLLIGTVAIGIAVDDTIHLTTRFKHEFGIHQNYHAALRAAMRDVGRALLITSVVLVAGFLVFLPSLIVSIALYGVLVAFTVVIALVADFFLMPALMLTFKPFGPERGAAAHADIQAA